MQIIFYEKPGCIQNTRQKKMLEECGHTVIARSILTEAWTADTLRPFFGNMPVALWFNFTAPRVKNREVIPHRHSEASALELMIADPILIRRPLIFVEGRYAYGFDHELVTELVNLVPTSYLLHCPNSQNPCP